MGRSVVACILIALLAAGCFTGRSDEAVPTPTTSPTTVTPPTVPAESSGFKIVDLQIAPADGRDRPLHEDDVAVVTYALVNDANTTASFIVSYIHNGVVEDTQSYRLAAGEARPFERRVGPLFDADNVRIEVRSGSNSAKADESVTPWPRTGETVDVVFGTFQVDRWLKEPVTGNTLVNATMDRHALPAGESFWFGIHVLCSTIGGNVTVRGDERPILPLPGTGTQLNIPLPGCEDVLYGVVITAKDGQDQEVYRRILFVDKDWRPAP